MKRARLITAACAGFLLLTTGVGCGIRATDVPVDAGPAPTRATCDAPADANTGTEVYLVCGSRVKSVQRPIDLPQEQDDRLAVAKALLAELQTDPGRDEQAAGFTSDVPPDLKVTGPEGNDPSTVLRLSKRPNDLSASALIQIICTFARSERLGDEETVVLGGPADTPSGQPRTYSCSGAMRATAGTPPTP